MPIPQPPATHSSTMATASADQLNMNNAAIAPIWKATMKKVVIQLIGSLKVLSFLRLTLPVLPRFKSTSEFPRYQGRKSLFVILVSSTPRFLRQKTLGKPAFLLVNRAALPIEKFQISIDWMRGLRLPCDPRI